MAGFFCLGDRDHHSTSKQEEADHQQQIRDHQNHHHQHLQQRNLFLYRSNDEIFNKGFEIWPQNSHQHQQHQHHLSNYMSFGLGSSSTTSPTATTPTNPARAAATTRNYSFNINDVVVSPASDDQPAAAALGFTMSMMRPQGGGLGSSSSTSGGMNCQDCGNQAKKDCTHMRCRTCCKSRGFQCQTHVKSTWVPAAKRRERQNQLAALQQLQQQQQQQDHHQHQQQFRVDTSKRQRDLSITTSSRNLPNTTTGLELGGVFPPEVNSPAVFRCVKVSAMDDADEHFAYQTAVNIGGHVFKGILYDQGPDGHFTATGSASGGGREGSSGHGRDDGTQQLNLITSATAATTANNNQSMSLLDPSLVYPTPINAFMAGTQFFPPPRS